MCRERTVTYRLVPSAILISVQVPAAFHEFLRCKVIPVKFASLPIALQASLPILFRQIIDQLEAQQHSARRSLNMAAYSVKLLPIVSGNTILRQLGDMGAARGRHTPC